MARKRCDNKKWKSRPSRKKSKNRRKKPCYIRRNNAKAHGSRKEKVHFEEKRLASIDLHTDSPEDLVATRIVQDFLSDRSEDCVYDKNLVTIVLFM